MGSGRRKRQSSGLKAQVSGDIHPGRRTARSGSTKRKLDQAVNHVSPKTVKGGSRGKPRTNKKGRRFISKKDPESPCGIACNGHIFSVGDCAYVVLDSREFDKMQEDDEPCAKCLKNSPTYGPMIECDLCLAGYHFKCLNPPLVELPECDWICPVCELGDCHPPRKPATLRELFLKTDNILTICQISKVVRRSNSYVFLGKRYIRPEATHCGRQKFHGAREVFLLDFCDEYEIERLVRPVNILSRDIFKNAPDSDDNFFVESSYNYSTQRFQRLGCEDETQGIPSSDEDGSSGYDPAEDASHHCGKFSARGRGERQGGGKGAIHETLKTSPTVDLLGGSSSKSNIYTEANCALALTSVPKSLTCRDTEKQKIEEFISSFACIVGCQMNSSNCLYICGVPGTGKTATVLETVNKCQSAKKNGKTAKKLLFKFVEVNCFRLPSPQHLYSHLLRALTDEWLGPDAAQRKLMQMFTNQSKTHHMHLPLLIVVDELDAIVTKDQKVLYNLSEWCTSKDATVAMIGIANTLDLPERLLPKIKSRMGHQRMCFKPYSREQIITIVQNRLKGIPLVFEELAVKMAAAKVAGINGDVRRALELLRVAIDVYNEDKDPEKGSLVKARHVQAAVFRMFQNPMNQMLHNTSPLEKIILAAFVLWRRGTASSEPSAGEIVDRVLVLMSNAMEHKAKPGRILARMSSLGDRRLLTCERSIHRLWWKVSLNVSEDDVMNMIRDDESFGWLKTVLGCKV